jgi:hypothetical protein
MVCSKEGVTGMKSTSPIEDLLFIMLLGEPMSGSDEENDRAALIKRLHDSDVVEPD